MFDRGVPSARYGLRGLTYCQIDVRGTASDLHSGSFGGAVANPAFVLAQMLAQMKDRRPRKVTAGVTDLRHRPSGTNGGRASMVECRVSWGVTRPIRRGE